ncbi:hypothetical protein B0H10DRAFT_2193759 [Mycena sp. CBHHK59/15]|nr:hypothetical protein B0H10DRAFT_2193759 [Mycena sp. CBHHK59/15]
MSNRDWHSAFPVPVAEPRFITPEELAVIIREKEIVKDYLVVDVRRTDFEDASIVGCLNLPAHSFFPTLPAILALLSSVPLSSSIAIAASRVGEGHDLPGGIRMHWMRKA